MRLPACLRLVERPPMLWRALCPEGIFRVNETPRTVYLTFDDGPIPEATPWVLDTLDAYGVKATFFMVGDNARRYPYLVKDVLVRGHCVGNHTMHHLSGARISPEVYLADVAEAARHIPSGLFRPPHGWLRPSLAKSLAGRYKIVMYDLVTRDYSRRLSADDVFDNVVRLVRPGSVIVFHDSLKSLPRLREALPRSLGWLLAEGYGFGLLSGR